MSGVVYLPPCGEGITLDCFTATGFNFAGRDVAIIPVIGSDVEAVWVRPGDSGYAAPGWYGVEFTSAPTEPSPLAATGLDPLTSVALGVAAVLAVVSGSILTVWGVRGRG